MCACFGGGLPAKENIMTYAAPDALAIGHVHLKVTDLERSIAFYSDVLG